MHFPRFNQRIIHRHTYTHTIVFTHARSFLITGGTLSADIRVFLYLFFSIWYVSYCLSNWTALMSFGWMFIFRTSTCRLVPCIWRQECTKKEKCVWYILFFTPFPVRLCIISLFSLYTPNLSSHIPTWA